MSKIAFENEIIIVDNQGIPQNYINGQLASQTVIDVIQKKVSHLISQGGIAVELDACQIEMRNMGPKDSLQQAQDELVELFQVVESTLRDDFGLYISQSVVPSQDYDPQCSNVDRYCLIHNALLSLGHDYRKATNIAGIHINIDSTLQEYFHINNFVHGLYFENDYQKLGISSNRLYQYQKAVNGVNQSLGMNLNPTTVLFDSLDQMQNTILDEAGEPKFDYGFTRLKRLGNQYVAEIRTFDGGVNTNDLIDKTTKAYSLVQDFRKQFINLTN
ncbi:MAG: hypothetical protein V3575_03650 [Candidatus Absconditabacteria bacterium]